MCVCVSMRVCVCVCVCSGQPVPGMLGPLQCGFCRTHKALHLPAYLTGGGEGGGGSEEGGEKN